MQSTLIAPIATHASLGIREDALFVNHKGKREKGNLQVGNEGPGEAAGAAIRSAPAGNEAAHTVTRCQAPVNVLEQLKFGCVIFLLTATVLVVPNR